MKCPFCGSADTQVVDSRVSEAGDSIRRRRRCLACQKRFTTYETAELRLPQVVKQNGTRSDFDVARIRNGFQRALHKRPVPTEYVDQAVERIVQQVLSLGEREIPSRQVGEMVMQRTLYARQGRLHPLRIGLSVIQGRRRFQGRIAESRTGAGAAQAALTPPSRRGQCEDGDGRERQRDDLESAIDREFMAAALELAERGLYTTTPNPRVGCVIVGARWTGYRRGLARTRGRSPRRSTRACRTRWRADTTCGAPPST